MTEAYNSLVASGAALTGYDSYAYVLPKEATSCSIGVGHLCNGGCGADVNFPRTWMRFDYGLRPDTFAHEVRLRAYALVEYGHGE